MSYDLTFWKTSDKTITDNNAIYLALLDGQYLSNIDELPSAQIQNDFNEVFSDWENTNNTSYEKGSEFFHLMISKQFVSAACYAVTQGNMNRIMDILFEYGCPLYDAQLNIRFDSDS